MLSTSAKLYKLVRLIKFMRIKYEMKRHYMMEKILSSFKVSPAIMRMLFTVVISIFLIHLVSCLWYFTARYKDFNTETWVVRLSLFDEEPSMLYLECVYWALQTVATVGYGNFGAITVQELILSVIWMVFGVGFYSFVISNLTLIVATDNSNTEILLVVLFP